MYSFGFCKKQTKTNKEKNGEFPQFKEVSEFVNL